MRLPKPIYELIPFFYFLIGCSIFILVESPLAIISTFLFFLASGLVWKMRKLYRNDPWEQHR